MTITKNAILEALKIKLETELFYAATGESACEELMYCIKRSPKEGFDRAETNFLVNNALSEVFFHGGRAERIKLCKVLQRSYWADISDKEIGLKASAGTLPEVF